MRELPDTGAVAFLKELMGTLAVGGGAGIGFPQISLCGGFPSFQSRVWHTLHRGFQSAHTTPSERVVYALVAIRNLSMNGTARYAEYE